MSTKNTSAPPEAFLVRFSMSVRSAHILHIIISRSDRPGTLSVAMVLGFCTFYMLLDLHMGVSKAALGIPIRLYRSRPSWVAV